VVGGGGRHGNAHRAAQKKQRRFYSGKKKRHTLKSQILVDYPSRSIICTAFAKGRTHDWKLLLESGVSFPKGLWILADSGYQGLQDITGNALIPKKKPKGGTLTEQEKRYNRMFASIRVRVENVLAWLKRFRILAERYRNRRRRFGLRFNLIAGLYNYELQN